MRPASPLSLAVPLGLGLLLVLVASRSGSAQDAPEIAGPEVVAFGQVFPSAPDLGPVASTPPVLDDVRRHLEAGDTRRALRAAELFVEHRKWGRERDAAWLVIGLLHREEGRHNLASEAFTKVRTADGPLASWGAWYEAEQDLERGRAWVAIQECETYRTTWPEGQHASACQRLIAKAHASLGRATAARQAAAAYDADHPDAGISEQIELALATWQVGHDPKAAVAPLQRLAIDHDAPLTGRVAEELLARLRADGIDRAVVPDDTEALKARAVSLLDAKRKTEAWAAFRALVDRSADDRELARWVEEATESFGWRAHQWDHLADWYRARYEASGRSEDSWNVYRALDRGGRHAEAAAWALKEQTKHANTRDWRRKEEVVARTLLLAREYAHAREQLDVVASRGGWTGRRAAAVAAFATLMEGDREGAVRRFDALIDSGDANVATEARYWRSRAHELGEQPELARADRAWILENDPWSWYGVLVGQPGPDTPTIPPYARDGTWPGPPVPPVPRISTVRPDLAITPTPPVHAPVLADIRAGAPGFGRLAWPAGGYAAGLEPREPTSIVAWDDELQPPMSYVRGTFHDPVGARDLFARFAESHADDWPELTAIHDLARAGLYDLSGPMMSALYEEWREATRSRAHPRHLAARRATLAPEAWRQLFYFSRDHHHTARFSHGLWDELTDPALIAETRKLAHPLAHDRYVWTHAREHGIDPFLVLGLMRQESTYNPIAVSRVGASGAMQIMPRTGHLLADLAHDTDFTAGDLEDPVLSVGYGIRYLGLLMQRFDGVYPLAIASYNGGPFNVSNWLRGGNADLPIDVFVEHIPFRETRDYVKKVTAGYAAYLALYTPEDTRIVLPPTARGDHPEIVDF